ncbi:MAG: rhodanese-like domain-containing protein [Gillisia sp.]
MKFRSIFLISTLVIFNSCSDGKASQIQVVSADEMQDKLRYNNVQVVDVQPEQEYKKSRLLNAQNILYDKNFRKGLERLDKNKPVAIYCTSGSVSPLAAKILEEAGFTQIYVLEGGIKKWQEENR